MNSELNKGRQELQLSLIEVQSWLFRLESISQQATEQVEQEIGRAAMAGMHNLRDIFELIVDGLNDRAFAGEQFIEQRDQTRLGLFLFLGQTLWR